MQACLEMGWRDHLLIFGRIILVVEENRGILCMSLKTATMKSKAAHWSLNRG